jgi:hypothetical protein
MRYITFCKHRDADDQDYRKTQHSAGEGSEVLLCKLIFCCDAEIRAAWQQGIKLTF